MILSDHFTAPTLDSSNWFFCNMTTPCTEVPYRKGDSQLALPEHQIWNEGNCLLSRRFLQQDSRVGAIFSGWDAECTGAGIGYYGGNGSYWGFVLLAATDTEIELRVHSGGQSGESFMAEGQPRWLTIARAPWQKQLPVKLELERQGSHYRALVEGQLLLEADIPEIAGDARAMYKALPWYERYTPCYAYLDWATAEGFAPTTSLSGQITNQDGAPIPYAGVHLAGFDEHFCLADQEGRFVLEQVPRGNHVAIAAAEGYAFASAKVCCQPGTDNTVQLVLLPETVENCPRREYNNPSFDRSENGWLCLNGTWQFCFDPQNTGVERHLYEPEAAAYDRHIRVPFSWASLMGFGEEHLACGDTLHETNTLFNNYNLTGEYAWYRRRFTVPTDFAPGHDVVLHIGASANVTCAWLDGSYQGMRVDEYSDLVFNLGVLPPGSTHQLVVQVRYPHHINSHNMGKQIFWFSSAPGIWQSVWIESRAAAHLTQLKLTPKLRFENEACSHAAVEVVVEAKNAVEGTVELLLTAPQGDRSYRLNLPLQEGRATGWVEIDQPQLWQYRQGNLYTVEAKLQVVGAQTDVVKSYLGLRTIETRWLPGHSPLDTDNKLEQYQYVYLNNKPFYVIGILDQCYNAFGIYTYRSLEAEGLEGARGSIVYDIEKTMEYGYNLSRVHIKENEPLWYHECDKRGLPVWTEHPANFYATPDDPNWQEAYMRELHGMLERLHNHPSIVMLSTINESWGVEGGHCKTPWENELRAQFLENNACVAKEAWPHVLVCDNSGFGKTAACELNDFHLYPNDHWDARARWEKLMEDCYPGSIYNFINRGHGAHAIGDAVQTGRPILISEFLHINGIDMQLRQFQKIAGYLRMNVASHETEDSGALTAERWERDYGFVDSQLQPLGYSMVNNMDMVVPDKNRIEYLQPGQTISIPISTSHFAWREVGQVRLRLSVTGIDTLGRYQSGLQLEEREIAFLPFVVEQQQPYQVTAPQGMRGAYVFMEVLDGDKVLCSNYIQLCIYGVEQSDHPQAHTISPASYSHVQGDYVWAFEEKHGYALTIHGQGEASYQFTLDQPMPQGVLLLEASAREGKNCIKVTDECRFGTQIEVWLDNHHIGTLCPNDEASDERALFSNAAHCKEVYNYKHTGRLGYGQRFALEVSPQLLTAGTHTLRFCCAQGGMVLYGRYTGRYGFDPVLLPMTAAEQKD